jgi:hypothetical protein
MVTRLGAGSMPAATGPWLVEGEGDRVPPEAREGHKALGEAGDSAMVAEPEAGRGSDRSVERAW